MLQKLAPYLLFYNISLKYRLLLYFLFLVILPTSIISVTIYNESNRTIKENITTTLQKNLATAEMILLKRIEEMEAIANSIYLNPDMIELLSADRPLDQVGIVNELANLNKIMGSYDLPTDLTRQFTPRLYMLDRPEYVQYNFSRYVSTIGDIEREAWYFDLPPKERYSIIALDRGTTEGDGDYMLMLAKRLFGLRNAAIPYVGLLTVESDIHEFTNILTQMKPSVNSTIVILDKQANVIVSTDKPALNAAGFDAEPYVSLLSSRRLGLAGSEETTLQGEAALMTYRSIDSLGWTVLSVSPLNDLNGKLVSLRKVMYLVLAVCMALAFLIALLLSGNITNPIRKFIKMMSYAKSGNFDIQIQYKRKDEFTYLFSQYNSMLQKIKELIDELYVSEVRKKVAELKALQAQINPHFLYNTLDSINWIALRHKVPEISHMVTSLSDFFRYSLSKGRDIIPIEDELRQVESYLSIQQIRFKERLTYSIEVEPEIYGHYAVKLTLQPLVENSLVHGIEKKRGVGVIAVKARVVNDWIHIEIIDNGPGANADELNAMLQSDGGHSFGLNNVNQRIRQVFGEGSGLQFRSNEGEGIAVIVKFPCRTTLEGLDQHA
ncbi:cache domain-containing sensor histidine kinase [Cohnella cellulosilytica]|uniref:Sensor histidine kinase n=1 Tax=Cohnella cellulosilytica TaxID=986710 RepID=A0ABW2F6K9_9BACL